MISFIYGLLFYITAIVGCSSSSERNQCPSRNGRVQYEEVAQKLVDPISELRSRETYSQNGFTRVLVSIIKSHTKKTCFSCRSEPLDKEQSCIIQTARVAIYLGLMWGSRSSLESSIYTEDFIGIEIQDAVLNVKLKETFVDNSISSTNVLQLLDLSVENISSSIEARKRSIPMADLSTWKIWALENTERLFRQAFINHRTVQCQWS